MIVFKVGEKFPKDCGDCPLWVDGGCGYPSYCNVGGEPTEEEIEAEEDGELNIYYHGYLTDRPRNCPLSEIEGGEHDKN